MSHTIVLDLVDARFENDETRVRARPGEWLDILVWISNPGHRRVTVVPRLVGLPPGWNAAPFEPIEVDASAVVAKYVSVQVAAGQPASTARIGLHATTDSDDNQSSVAFRIDVVPTADVSMRVEPRVAVGGKGRFTLHMSNGPERWLSLKVEGREWADECDVRAAPSRVELAPREHDHAEIVVTGHRPWFGNPVPRPVEITATDRSGESWRIDAQLRQSPRIPRWLIVTVFVLLLVAIWLAIMIAVITFVREDPVDPFDPPPRAAGSHAALALESS